MQGKESLDGEQPADPAVYANATGKDPKYADPGLWTPFPVSTPSGPIYRGVPYADPRANNAPTSSAQASLDRLRDLGRKAVMLAAVAISGAIGTYVANFARQEVKVVEKEVLKTVEVPTIIDRKVEVPVPGRPFGSTCPKCGTYHWAYPPGSPGGSAGEKTGEKTGAKSP